MNMNNPFFLGGEFFSAGNSGIMGSNGLTVVLNMPPALKSKHGANGEEIAHRLPPYAQRAAFRVSNCPDAPEDWMRDQPGLLSYMVAVEADRGLWLDFTRCAHHTHDVAVLISVQGVNPITGKKADNMRLEQYKHNCPVHNIPLVGDRRCEKCGHKWPHQNYISTTGNMPLWLDGFFSEDGKTRQWVFTEDQCRSVAKAVIGDERVPAIGVAFFLSKQPKPRPVRHSIQESHSLSFGGNAPSRGLSMSSHNYEVAAGAEIHQEIAKDPKDPSYWQDQPELTVVINYTDMQTLLQVLQSKRKAASGFLSQTDVKVGN